MSFPCIRMFDEMFTNRQWKYIKLHIKHVDKNITKSFQAGNITQKYRDVDTHDLNYRN